MSARNPTYPGVYILELPSAVRTITGVSTSITAFIGRALKGPVNDPTTIHSFAEYQRTFGGIWRESTMSYAVFQYFQNGGRDAVILRVHNNARESKIIVEHGGNGQAGTDFTILAANPGQWSSNLEVVVTIQDQNEIEEIVEAEKAISPKGINTLFDLSIQEKTSDTEPPNVLETFRNLSTKKESPRFVARVLQEESDLVRAEDVADPPVRPPGGTFTVDKENIENVGSDGATLTDTQIIGGVGPVKKEGLSALDAVDLFNLLCIPPYDPAADNSSSAIYSAVYPAAIEYCERRRAVVLIDPPSNWDNRDERFNDSSGINSGGFRSLRHKNAAIFFPRIVAPDPEEGNRPRIFVPCGAVAGIIARTDSERGIWKSPAGIEATLNGVTDLSVRLTDSENGDLNPLGINCLRIMPPAGIVIWGARTLRGADRLADQWKYLAVRRMALYIEESLYRGTQWVVFEPNGQPLWDQIRLNVGAFMHNLFRQGAFQGSTPKDAYFVKCDSETTTQYDIDRGIVNIVVGFAPLKPSEFVVIQIQQMTRGEQ